MQPKYDPSVFNVSNLADARSIILTEEGSTTPDSRWQTETPYLFDVISRWLAIKPPARVLDFGCGVGRLSKLIAERFEVEVVGVDISVSMRQLAPGYVQHPLFTAISPQLLDAWVSRQPGSFDLALTVWVLQHCNDVEAEVDRLHRALRPNGVLFVVDMKYRAVPTSGGWIDDGKSVAEALSRKFQLVHKEPFAAPEADSGLLQSGWMGLYQKT